MTDRPWWKGARPVGATVVCGGASHRLRWERGQLLAPDHPDPEGERLLAALGGAQPRCLRLVDLWARHEHDLRALTLGSRGPDDQPAVDVDLLDADAPAFLPPSPLRRPAGIGGEIPLYSDLHFEDRWQAWREVVELLNLPAALQVRWGASAAAHAMTLLPVDVAPRTARAADLRADPTAMTVKELEQAGPAIASAILDAAVTGRARRALRAWLGPGPAIGVEVLPSGGIPTLRWAAGDVHVAVRHDWLTRVWGQGLTTVIDAFTLDAIEAAPDTTTLQLARRGGAITMHHLEAETPPDATAQSPSVPASGGG